MVAAIDQDNLGSARRSTQAAAIPAKPSPTMTTRTFPGGQPAAVSSELVHVA